ncbi:MetQ/NlpA family ABC transporter substrate-binding protein [Helicobacter trogontum]|uniref:ABC transporter substrate-binding protein n=1 Tax=Helicobacter trogontum TaxID=50960 RepID=A0A4U8TE66_9HELI|nr:MetQ/NlpA family ABC transporter substrate-binding protein [Helicobacter trogontum]MDY5186071.1 MetQ/NlpA family ABC transporter substrate-binding protein [Helicobacter trogontum]TLD98326.1 ABC transporter substrate-binding protein [Helicobacter trogontum]
MKKFISTSILVASLALGSLQVAFAGEVKVGATPVPHAAILKSIVPMLDKKGVQLKIVEFTDYVTPNLALADKSLDANFMQHLPYLQKINKDKNLNLVSVAQVHVEPLGIYSKKLKKLDELQSGAKIAIPSDPTNGARALILLHNNGVITLKDPKNLTATLRDIKKNPKKLKIMTADAALLPKMLDDVAFAVINGNFAMQNGLSNKDTIAVEDARSPYANILVVRAGDENKPDIIELKKALQSPEVKKFIEDTYKGEVVPAF